MNIEQLVKNAIEIYQRLLAVGFLGDVSLYSLEEAMTIWEGEFVHKYLAEEVAAFSIEKIDELVQAFYNFRQTKEEQIVQPLPHLIAQEQAERLAQRRLRDQNILYHCMTACDLRTQSAYLTESPANNYEPAAWKVWYIYHAEKEDRLPGSDLCYIAIPKAKLHVIR